MPGDTVAGEAAQGNATEPGFGDTPGQEALPDMRDVLPTFDESYGDASGQAEGQSETKGTGGASGDDEGQGNPSGTLEGPYEQVPAAQGTRAEGGMEGMSGVDGTLTTMEQVAILDRQLQQSTNDFDAMILEEQKQQREEARARAIKNARRQGSQSATERSISSIYNDDIENPLPPEQNSGSEISRDTSSSSEEIISGLGNLPEGLEGTPPKENTVPADIPPKENDDTTAAQLRELATREQNPVLREKYWNEYRKYMGLEVPAS